MLVLARRSLARVPSTRLARHLGSWEGQFVAARGAPLEARAALSAKVEADWVVERDEEEAAALAAEVGGSADNQVTFVLTVQETRVAILRASMLNGNTGLLVGTQCDPALTLTAAGTPLVRAAIDELKARGAERVVAVAPLAGLCAWVVEHKLWEKLDASAPDHDPEQAARVRGRVRLRLRLRVRVRASRTLAVPWPCPNPSLNPNRAGGCGGGGGQGRAAARPLRAPNPLP